MKRIIMLGRLLLLLLCALPIILLSGCGDDNGDSIARISDYTTIVPRDVTTPANSRFVGFNIQSRDERIGYSIGYAVIVNGIRTDHILFEFDPATMAQFSSTSCSFVISGNFFGEHISIVHRQFGEGWSYISDSIMVEVPALTGNNILTRPVDFEAALRQGDDLVLAAAIGSAEGEVFRPIEIDFFDNFRTIEEAMNDQNMEDRPFLLIFYISANS
jgi:hypothetical protein